MASYVIRRLIYLVLTLLATIVLIFTLMEFVPGDPAQAILGPTATEETIAQVHEQLGLDDPYLVRLGDYILGLLQGDLGESYKTGQPVFDELMARFPVTLKITVFAVIIGSILGIIAGVVSAVKQYSIFDRVLTAISLFGASAPSFWLAMLFVLIFSLNLGWLPATGSYGFEYWILPIGTLGLQCSASITRMTRSSMLEVIRQDYVRTARAKGQVQWKVIISHALRNAMIPILTIIGTQACGYIGGTVLIESVFGLPGIGNYILDSVNNLDYPVVTSGIIFICFWCVLINFVVDLLYAFIDPRIKITYGFKEKKKKAKKQVAAAQGGNA